MIYNPFYLIDYFWFPQLPSNCEKPPTVYSILESIVNYGKDDKQKIKDLAKEGRSTIFNFDYPLTDKVNKEEFECMILNHYLMRRIGFDTVTAFRIQLNVKLNEIMPVYNKMFELLYNNDLFGEITKKVGTDNRTTENNSTTENTLNNNSENETISDLRNSKLPQNKLQNLRDGSYVTDYNYNTTNSNDKSNSSGTSSSNANGTDNNEYNETISRIDMFDIYTKFNSEIKHIYTLIFNDLDELFYSLV